MIHRKVKFKDVIYWHHQDDGDYELLSHLSDFDDNGELLANPFVDISYAVIEEKDILRHHEIIGKTSELEEIKE